MEETMYESIVEDAMANLAMRESVYREQMDEIARSEPETPDGMWSRRALLRLIIPEDKPERFEPYATIAAQGLMFCVATGALPPDAAFASAFTEGVQLGREIERLSRTGKYPLPREAE